MGDADSLLLGQGLDTHVLRSQMAQLCEVDPSVVQDAYPCTPLQEGLVAITAKTPGKYVLKSSLQLSESTQPQELATAWSAVVLQNSILRTRIVQLPGCGLVQVVLGTGTNISRATNLEEYESIRKTSTKAIGLGKPLLFAAIVGPDNEGRSYFALDIHHALYDGYSLSLLFRQLEQSYRGSAIQPLLPMRDFIQHTQKMNSAAAESFWSAQFARKDLCPFPSLGDAPSSTPSAHFETSIQGLQSNCHDFTMATAIKSALAIVMAEAASTTSALFGNVVTGRQAHLEGIEHMEGPAIATVPIAVDVDVGDTVRHLLLHIQTQAAEMIPFEQTGLSKIQKICDEAALASRFQTLLVIQASRYIHFDVEHEPNLFYSETDGTTTADSETEWQDFSTYGLVIECQPEADGLDLHVAYDPAILPRDKLTHLITNFESTLRAISSRENLDLPLGVLMGDVVIPWGLERVWEWNANVVSPATVCVHTLIEQQRVSHPNAIALCAWDGDVTYRELDDSANLLARYLHRQDVSGTVIPLLFEKSKWMPIAAIAAMKVGAASVALDPKQPLEKLGSIMKAVSPLILMISQSQVNKARQLSDETSVKVISPEAVMEELLVGSGSLEPLNSNWGACFDGQSRSPTSSEPGTLLSNSAGSLLSDSGSTPSVSLSVTTVTPSTPLSPSDSPRSLPQVFSGEQVLPDVHSDSVAYVAFTSGSTGIPKGALVTHQNVSSAIASQLPLLGYRSDSRIFDFASYSFDASWFNLLFALSAGSCLCIPSEDERENDLAASLAKYDINVVDFTPSVARMLGPKVLSRLSTLVLGGEAMCASDVKLVALNPKTKVLNVYGPAECTPVSTIAEIVGETITIGTGVGACTWVVDVNNPFALAPLGAIGELCIEGPIVGSGYINDPQRTQNVFEINPAWLQRGVSRPFGETCRPGRQGRVYHTGDLVRYLPNGTVQFEGRKDTQVKIRGQRVELEDIERHVQAATIELDVLSMYRLCAVAETVRPPSITSAQVIVFLVPQSPSNQGLREDDFQVFERKLQSMEGNLIALLSQRLPVYMMPSCIFALQYLPLSTSRKTDRIKLREIGLERWKAPSRGSENKYDHSPATDTEEILQRIWTSVLNLPADEVAVTRPFTRMGGDSITAMQIVSQCRLHSIQVTVSDILRSSTIRTLASLCQKKAAGTAGDKIQSASDTLGVEGDESLQIQYSLSPIQQMFFEAHPNGLNYFNQSYLFVLQKAVRTEIVKAALEAIVRRHSMLRARFSKNETTGQWTQAIAPYTEETFSYEFKSVKEARDVFDHTQSRQHALDIVSGPLFACDLFEVSDGSRLMAFTAHHLVVDLVSWRIIWKDFEDYVQSGVLLSDQPTSFTRWSVLQEKHGSTLSPLSVLPFSVPFPDTEFWGMAWQDNDFTDVSTVSLSLDATTSDLLFGTCNDTLGTEALDIMLGAVAFAFHQTFPTRPVPSIWMEGHGREATDISLPDATESVGWFTSIFPLSIPLSNGAGLMHAIRLAKDCRRKLPGKGQHYFACRYYSEAGQHAFKYHSFAEVMFNFTGRFQQLEREEGLLKVCERPSGAPEIVEMSPQTKRSAFVEIQADVSDGIFSTTFSYHNKMSHQAEIISWMQRFIATLRDATTQLTLSPRGFTLVDFTVPGLTYEGIDDLVLRQLPELRVSVQDVMDLQPCSPMQNGILLSSEKGAASYSSHCIFTCRSITQGFGEVDPIKLESAWKTVAARHSILSTIFAVHPAGVGFLQIVLSNAPARVVQLTVTEQDPAALLSALEEPRFASNEPCHRLTICASDNGTLALRLDISHALIDAISLQVLLHELSSIYHHKCLQPAPPYSALIRHIGESDHRQKTAAWAHLLRGVQPCHFPTRQDETPQHDIQHRDLSVPLKGKTDAIKMCCQSLEITTSVFFQVAWGLVLSYFTGKDQVCFGYLASGRDVPIDGVEIMVGPLVSMLISRLDTKIDGVNLLRRSSKDSIKHLGLQHASLAEIQHDLGLSGASLFNTSMSLRTADQAVTDQESLHFELCGTADTHEHDLGLNVGVGGHNIDVLIEYREPFITTSTARAVASTLSSAVDFLLMSTSAEQCAHLRSAPAREAFFEFITGAQEPYAIEFWSKIMRSPVEARSLRPRIRSQPAASSLTRCISIKRFQTDFISLETCIQAAWAVLIAKYNDASSVSFGYADSRAPVATPLLICLDWEQDVQSFLHQTQDDFEACLPYRKVHSTRIGRIGDTSARPNRFESVLTFGATQQDISDQDAHEFVTVQKLSNDEIVATIKYSEGCSRDGSGIVHVMGQLEQLLQQLTSETGRTGPLRQIVATSSHDSQSIYQWNANLPETVDACVHERFSKQARKTPHAFAVDAWNGQLTYLDLEQQSNRVARSLLQGHVTTGSVVAVYFEKSVWMPVAVLGTMKAGAAVLLIDPTKQPPERVRAMVEQAHVGAILTSTMYSGAASEYAHCRTLVVEDVVGTKGSTEEEALDLPNVDPSSCLYVVFTSGSTSVPKGVMVSHQNMASAAFYQARAFGFGPGCRVLDFSSYAFDVVWSNVVNTFTTGGCLCIPSDAERDQDLPGCLSRYRITIADFTPSLVRHLGSENKLPGLSTLVLGGERVLPSDADLVDSSTCKVFNAYGPAECTPTSLCSRLTRDDVTGNIGTGRGLRTWIVDLQDSSVLAPVGAIGELWLEGPLVGQGYMGHDNILASGFVQHPGPWKSEHLGKLYRTGDIVRYESNGSIVFVGRRDNQVKIRGQRVELEEVEAHVRSAIEHITANPWTGPLAAEVIQPQGSDSPTLVVFVAQEPPAAVTGHQHAQFVGGMSGRVQEQLHATVPTFMMPSALIPVSSVPRLASGKLDRKTLRAQGAAMTNAEMAQLSRGARRLSDGEDASAGPQKGLTSAQTILARLWAEILHLQCELVLLDDSFFRLGGDSIGAMKLSSLARRNGLDLSVRDIFKQPKLVDMAEAARGLHGPI